MEPMISEMLTQYEAGSLNRRQFIQALVALASLGSAAAASQPPFKGVGLNHIAIRVTNVQRSRDFYQKLLGLPVIREAQTNCFLGLGTNFLTLFQNQNPGLDHYCIAIQNFNIDSVVETLKAQGLNARRPRGTDRVYFPDPDGIEVQLSPIDHRA